MRIPVRRLDPELPLPVYAHEGDAGADLVAREGAVLRAGGGRALVPTGIAIWLIWRAGPRAPPRRAAGCSWPTRGAARSAAPPRWCGREVRHI